MARDGAAGSSSMAVAGGIADAVMSVIRVVAIRIVGSTKTVPMAVVGILAGSADAAPVVIGVVIEPGSRPC